MVSQRDGGTERPPSLPPSTFLSPAPVSGPQAGIRWGAFGAASSTPRSEQGRVSGQTPLACSPTPAAAGRHGKSRTGPVPGAGGVRLLCGPRQLKPPNHGRAECRAQRLQDRSLQNKDIRTKQASQMTDGRPGPVAGPQEAVSSSGPGPAPKTPSPQPRLASRVRPSGRRRGTADSAPGRAGRAPGRPCQGRPQTALLHLGRRGGRRRPQMELWEEGRCLPTPRIMALEHWEEVGQKGIKAVFTAHRGHKAPAGLATLSGLLPRDRPKVTG